MTKPKPPPPPPPKVKPKPPPPAPTPPAPAGLQAAEIDAARLERAETLPVMIIPPVDADTALKMENDRLVQRVAALEAELREIQQGRLDYTRLHNLLHAK